MTDETPQTLRPVHSAAVDVCSRGSTGFIGWRTNSLRSEVARINDEGIGNRELSEGWFWPVADGNFHNLSSSLFSMHFRMSHCDFAEMIRCVGQLNH